MKYLLIVYTWIIFSSCFQLRQRINDVKQHLDSNASLPANTINDTAVKQTSINTLHANPGDVIKYAETLIGTPYLYASTDPQLGFDCSGFITYVFNHFNINVPRSSVEFTNAAPEVFLKDAKPGDLILFTGTDSTIHTVGHMGIIIAHDDVQTLFIHSSSGKANGVTITPLNDYYMSRFVKVIRIFPENNE